MVIREIRRIHSRKRHVPLVTPTDSGEEHLLHEEDDVFKSGGVVGRSPVTDSRSMENEKMVAERNIERNLANRGSWKSKCDATALAGSDLADQRQ